MQKQREHWSSRLGFILAAAGSAIGLGTLWKFPYTTGENGGGLFVLFYIFCLFFIGMPIFIAELAIGRKAQRGAVGVFSSFSGTAKEWKVIGWLGVISSFLIMSYYSVIAGWGLNYVLLSLSQSLQNKSAEEIDQVFHVLSSSGDITLFWHFLFTCLTMSLVYPGVRKGVEYWSRYMTSSLFVMLTCLCLYSTTLEGFSEAVRFLFLPDLAEFKPSSALEALGLSFFTLSLGQGIMLTYGSYMERSEDIPKTAGIIGITITIVSIAAGLMIFPIIFTLGSSPQGGPGLIFRTMPLLFQKLPSPLLISTTFFTLFVFTALTSSMAFVEVIVANFIDLLGWSRKRAVTAVGLSCFIFGIPSALSQTNTLFGNWSAIYGKTFFVTIEALVSVWLLPLGGFLTCLFVGWALDDKVSKQEFQAGTALPWLWKPWKFFMRWVAPLMILTIILQKSGLINIDTLMLSLFSRSNP